MTSRYLTHEELVNFQNKLLDRRVQIEKNLNGTELEMKQMQSLELNDEGDYAAASSENVIDNAILMQQRKELNEIESALGRIKHGTYGTCDMCEEPIGKARLEVKSFALYCIDCREIVEKTNK